jgi:hypothetical protein
MKARTKDAGAARAIPAGIPILRRPSLLSYAVALHPVAAGVLGLNGPWRLE